MQSRRSLTAPALVGALLITLAFAMYAPWPDDWDGIGFLASIDRFDMATFSPHAPGYPVYVALLKLARLVSHSGMEAARLVACLSCGMTYALVFGVLRDWAEEQASSLECALGAAFVCMTPLGFHAFSAVGSEAPALAFAALALRGVTWRGTGRTRAILVGLGIGLGVGVRLSWAPLYVPLLFLLPRSLWLRSIVVAKLAALAWLVPLVLITTPTRLLALYRTHLGGHITRWGGTALTDPQRGRFLARDILSDGFGAGFDPLGIVVLVAVVVALGLAFGIAVCSHRSLFAKALFVTLPYLLWIAVGQNLREQPRHALPIVAALSLGIVAVLLVATPGLAKSLALSALLSVVGWRTASDALDRHRVPPAGAQLASLVERMNIDPHVFAGASARFFDAAPTARHVHAVASLGDALLALSRVDRPGPVALVTSELTGLEDAPVPLRPIAHLCRPPRLDRRTPCLDVYALDDKPSLNR